jgi:hypothetical protein
MPPIFLIIRFGVRGNHNLKLFIGIKQSCLEFLILYFSIYIDFIILAVASLGGSPAMLFEFYAYPEIWEGQLSNRFKHTCIFLRIYIHKLVLALRT